ncbi:hypothetical protein AB4178_07500 [Vibrio splendidus]
MMEIQTIGKGALGVLSCLKSAYDESRKRKIDTFMKYIDTRYEVMSVSEREQLKDYLKTNEGQDLLSDYVNNALNTSSKTVVMAYALLYCDDPDFGFMPSEKRSIISSLQGISDELVSLFLELTKLKPTHEFEMFNRVLVTYQIGEKIEHGGNLYVDVADLIRRGMLLPDPKPSATDSSDWDITFAVSPRALQCARLLEKSKSLLKSH